MLRHSLINFEPLDFAKRYVNNVMPSQVCLCLAPLGALFNEDGDANEYSKKTNRKYNKCTPERNELSTCTELSLKLEREKKKIKGWVSSLPDTGIDPRIPVSGKLLTHPFQGLLLG